MSAFSSPAYLCTLTHGLKQLSQYFNRLDAFL